MTAVASPRRPIRLIGLVGACALAIVSLSGCLKLDADLTVNADATASGTLTVEFQKEAAGFLGINDLDSFEEGFTQGELAGSGLDTFSDCTTSETDAAYVYTCTFENDVFEDDDGPWTITKEGDLVVLRVVNEGESGGTDDSLNLLGDANLGSLTVSATFPGPITAVSGDAVEKTSDTTATISGSLTESIDASVTSESSSGGFSLSSLLVILLALAVLALIVIVVVVLILRRRKGSQDGDVSPVDGAPVAPAAAAAGVVAADTMAATEIVETTEVVETATETLPATEIVETTEVVETATETLPATEVVETATQTLPATEIVETVTEFDDTVVVETVADSSTDPQPPPA